MKREPLARLLGTNHNLLLDWEKGRRLPEGQYLERVRKFIAETPMEGREERKEEIRLPDNHHSNGGPKRPKGKEGNDDKKETKNRWCAGAIFFVSVAALQTPSLHKVMTSSPGSHVRVPSVFGLDYLHVFGLNQMNSADHEESWMGIMDNRARIEKAIFSAIDNVQSKGAGKQAPRQIRRHHFSGRAPRHA